MSTQPKSMEELVSLCKRRGFIYPASEIYGGINGFWDYGPLGSQLKNNLRDAWWEAMVLNPPNGPDGEPLQIVGLDSSIIQNPKVWEASGHVGGFNDPMVDDKETKQRFRADKVWVVGFMSADHYAEYETLLEQLSEKSKLTDAFSRLVGAIESTKIEREGQIFVSGELWKLVQPLERQLLEMTQELDPQMAKVFTPTLCIAVEADSAEQAELVAVEKLTKKQRSLLGDSSKVRACDHLHLAPYWPRLSPATQRETVTEPRMFNLMFETFVGAIRDESSKVYLRPETAQGIFVNFKNVVDTTRVRVPFGIAQVGKAFRNEVTPRNFIFRSREFEQMEMEWFCHASEAAMWSDFWQQTRLDWWKRVGLTSDDLQMRKHGDDELSHYAKEGVGTFDVEYRYPFTAPGFGELEGVSHRSNFDLTQHQAHSKAKLEYFDQQRDERYIPHVIEPAAGLSRGVLAILCEAFTPDPERPSKVYMKFTPEMAPIKAAVFPLVNKDGMPEVAAKLTHDLRKRYGKLGFIETDPKQSIGKRYARMDEAGCPYCFTIDGDTLADQTVTVRDRDTASQDRIALDRVPEFLNEKLGM
ncbi:MAG: glycine--tRNA ligase [Phycisphaerales bacterium JB037]